LQELFDKNKPEKSMFAPELHLKLYPSDDSIKVRFLVILSEAMNPLKSVQIPEGFREGLKNTDQYIKFKVVMGADAEEIMSSDKPIVEHYLKGFSVQLDVVFLKQIKYALLAGLENHPFG
jgi:hypothetical protein